jgi:short-subunit dehydrogenase
MTTTKTILVCGYGPGISDAVARKFASEGFSVALIARGASKVKAAESALTSSGVKAKAFPCDLGDPSAVKKLIADVRESLGPITVVHWNAYVGGAGDFTTADVGELRAGLDVSVTGLVAAVQAALPDMKSQKESAVLVTGGGLSTYDPRIDAMAVSWNAMGLAIAKAAQHKLVGLLAEKLRGDGIYVGEVVVLGAVKGTAFDGGQATLEPSTIAAKFWDIYRARGETSVQIAG